MANTLLHSPAKVVQRLLIQLGLGTDPDLRPLQAWPVYRSGEPQTPDNLIVVRDTTGLDFGSLQVDGEVQRHEGFQVRIRSATESAGYLKSDEIWTALCKLVLLTEVPLEGSTYLVQSIVGIGDVLSLGKAPDSDRNLLTINARIGGLRRL